MPLPSPNKGQKKNDFISNCIESLSKKGEFKDQKQRAAVCYDRWENFKKASAACVQSGGEEFFLTFPCEKV